MGKERPAMNCRNCGAAMQPVSGAAYFRCPHCGTFEFPRTTDDGVATLNEVSEFGCPVCKQSLGTAAISGHPIHFCGTCRGFLTTNAAFSEILAHRRAENADRPTVTRTIDPDELRRRVCCPKCKKPMDAHPYGGGGNVVIDTCHRCHLIWLDCGEMETLARHHPKDGTAGLLPVVPDRPPEEPQTGLRWAWDDHPRHRTDDMNDGVSLIDLFRRLL